jgi:hypothetical protein
MKRIINVILVIIMALQLSGCGDNHSVTIVSENQEVEQNSIVYEAMLYDNYGNNFLNFTGNEFTITPNKVKQWGWNTGGSWTWWYDTSSVVTIEIDGNYIQSCGSTVLFKDTRLEMLEIPSELNIRDAKSDNRYTVSVDGEKFKTYLGLKNWWYDMREKGQHGEKVVLIQSQDGYNIGSFIGNDITWQIADALPKTTKIMIDGLPLYIHRCNFTIIDSGLLDK